MGKYIQKRKEKNEKNDQKWENITKKKRRK